LEEGEAIKGRSNHELYVYIDLIDFQFSQVKLLDVRIRF
jgi:hypothetical protein